MPFTTLMPSPRQRFYTNAGTPAAFHKLYTFAAGTTNNKVAYQDAAGTVPHENPITLDAKGEALIYFSGAYKIDLKDPLGNQVTGFPVDNFSTQISTAELTGSDGAGLVGFDSSATYSAGSIGRWLKDLALSAGASMIGFIQAGVGAIKRSLEDKSRDTVSVFDFMTEAQIADARANTKQLDCTAAINAAFGSSVFSKKTVVIPGGCSLKITGPITIPCGASFIGGGASSTIVADFGAWVGTDFRAIIVKSRDGTNYFGNEYGQVIGQFSVFGINNTGVASIGMDFRATNTIDVGVAVNHSFYGGTVRNILVSGFDTAYNIEECWNTTFDNVYAMYCRAGILIRGKSVNLTFSEVRLTNFTNASTSSVAATQGVDIRSKVTYTGGVEGRPEGIVFTPGCLIFGSNTNIYVSQCLYFRITDSIIDGAQAYGVRVGTADGVTISGNYIYASAVGGKGVSLDSVATSDSLVVISHNHFVGTGVASQTAVDAGNGLRAGVRITGNFFRGWARPIFLNNCINSEVTRNYGRSNVGELIQVQTGCDNTVIDKNTSDDAFAILLCQPSTSALLDIRANTSPTTKTFARGKVTLLAGTTSIAIPNGLHSGVERYLRAYTRVKVSANVGNHWVADPASTSSTATFTCSAAPAADVAIYYESQAIPSSGL